MKPNLTRSAVRACMLTTVIAGWMLSNAAQANQYSIDQVRQEAPSDWNAFEAWVIQELQTKREPVPVPAAPVLAESRYEIIRLHDALPQADVRCDWTPAVIDETPVLKLGPYRTDLPTEEFKVQKRLDRKNGWELRMTLSGFKAPTDKIGKLLLKLRVPYGDFFEISWVTGGSIRFPIVQHDDLLTLELKTRGLTRWEGVIDHLSLRTDGYDESAVVEIESIQFLGLENAYPRPAADARCTAAGDSRSSVYAHCPSEITFYNLRVPPNGKLAAGLAAVTTTPTNAQPPSRVRFQIAVSHDERREVVLDRNVPANADWSDEAVSLAKWSGQNITLSLMTESDDQEVVALWGAPILYEPMENPPIVVLYLIDALSAKHCSLYGYERPTVPVFEELAKNGVWFSNNYTGSPVTVASVPDTQLSMPAERHGVYNSSLKPPPELVTLAEALKAAGFSTASFITNANAGERQGMDQGFEEYYPRALFFWKEKNSISRSIPLRKVMQWMKRHSDRPAFAYIHTCEPHAPYTPPEGYKGRFDPDYKGALNGTMSKTDGYAAAKTPREIKHICALYDEECLFADDRLGRFLKRMNNAGLADRMTMLVIADHGEELKEHGHWGHGLGLYDEVLRVPLIASGSLITQRGRNDLPVCLYDVMPTILDLLDVPFPYDPFGVSLRSQLQTTSTDKTPPELNPQRVLITSHHRYAGRGYIEYSVVEALKWKLHYRYMLDDMPDYPQPARFELYDLENDPRETRNLMEDRRDVAKRLMLRLTAYAREQHPYETQAAAGGSFDAAQLQDLQNLGYIDADEEEEDD